MSRLIASRKLVSDVSSDDIALVRLYSPEENEGNWRCCYKVRWRRQEKKMNINGSDSFQSLLLAVELISAEISSIENEYKLKFNIEGGIRGHKFPIKFIYKS